VYGILGYGERPFAYGIPDGEEGEEADGGACGIEGIL